MRKKIVSRLVFIYFWRNYTNSYSCLLNLSKCMYVAGHFQLFSRKNALVIRGWYRIAHTVGFLTISNESSAKNSYYMNTFVPGNIYYDQLNMPWYIANFMATICRATSVNATIVYIFPTCLSYLK